MFGIRSECSSSHHEGYYQHGADAEETGLHSIHVHRWHLYQWGCHACDPHQRTSGLLWAGMQRSGMVEGRRMSAGTGGGGDITRWVVMEARKRGSRRPSVVTGQMIFFMSGRLVGHLLMCGWLHVACGILNRRTSLIMKVLDEKMGDVLLQHMVSETGLCTTGWTGLWRLVRGRPRAERAGQCQFSGDQSGFGETWNSAGRCLLAATREWHPTYQPCRAGHYIERCQLTLQWQSKVLHVKTDSVCVYHWVSDTLTGRAWVRTKTASEMLIRKQLNTLKDLVDEY